MSTFEALHDHDVTTPEPRKHRLGRAAGANVSDAERSVSVVAGGILAGLGLYRQTLPGLLVAAVGGAMIHRGVTGNCAVYSKLGINTATEEDATTTK